MAKSHLPRLRHRHTYSALLNDNAAASSRYHAATSELMSLAGQQNAARFNESKQNCEDCLDDCKRTAAAMRTHKAAHGC